MTDLSDTSGTITQQERDSDAARKTLDRHGHGFHYAVLKALGDIQSGWRIEASEFPVDLNGVPLHIDIVLRSERAVMAVECKRVNPALGQWCFARSSFVSTSDAAPHLVLLERLHLLHRGTERQRVRVTRALTDTLPTREQYHIAQEVKTGQAGDGAGGRSAIDDAVTQAIRGASGLAEAYAGLDEGRLMEAPHLFIVPVIVTTARLVVLGVDLSDADLQTGNLPLNAPVEERPWLCFRTMTSSRLRHNVPSAENQSSERRPYSLGGVADHDYARSVAVVSVSGLPEFLQRVSPHHTRAFT